MHKINVNGAILYANDGMLLSDVLTENGIYVSHPCGGKGICKKCTVTVNGNEVLSCKYRINSDITVKTDKISKVHSDTGVLTEDTHSDALCYALDIGTTTLALALVDRKNGKAVKVVTDTNPQTVFGADVMSRIEYCMKNGVKTLQECITQKVDAMITLLGKNSADTLFVSGNTVMLHLFFGEDCSSMGKAPYTPVFLNVRSCRGDEVGISGIKEVISLPAIAAFIGADITAGLNYVDLPEKGKFSLLTDLGTNAETVLFSEDEILCTSAAAGPCFEGANISCGMSATAGAISEYRSATNFKVTENAPPKGICSTGLIDVIATLVNNGIIDKTGYMESGSFRITKDIILTQNDVRQFQLAKSAVFSAISVLLAKRGLAYRDIDKLFISGGFSANINISNAITAGLIPKELKDRCRPISNSSLLGTIKYAAENNSLKKLTDKAEYIDLTEDKHFSELFLKNITF